MPPFEKKSYLFSPTVDPSRDPIVSFAARELVSIPHKILPSRPIFRLEDLEDTMGGGGKVFNRDLKFANRIESRYWTVLRAGEAQSPAGRDLSVLRDGE